MCEINVGGRLRRANLPRGEHVAGDRVVGSCIVVVKEGKLEVPGHREERAESSP